MPEIITDDAQKQCTYKRRGLILLLSSFMVVCINIKSQNEIKPKTRMEHFDIKKFEENNPNKSRKTETLKNGDVAVFCFITDRYIKKLTAKATPYIYYTVYDLMGRIKSKITNFSLFEIGKSYEYDELGNIIKVTDNDVPYKFTLEKLREKVEKEYHVDIMDKKKLGFLNRAKKNERIKFDTYELCFPDKEDALSYHYLLIDANTGTTIFSSIKPKFTERYSVYSDYLDSLKNSSSGSEGGDSSENSSKKGLWERFNDYLINYARNSN